MLTLRQSQLQAMHEARLESLARRLAAALCSHLPVRCAALGPEAVRVAVRNGIERARRHGLASERDLLRYLNLMFALGFDFEVSPRYPWAAPLLAEIGMRPSRRLDRLIELASDALEERT